METLKNVFAVLAGLVGVLTAILTLYAKYLDVTKAAAREGDAARSATPPTRPEPAAGFAPVDGPHDPFAHHAPPSARYAPGPSWQDVASTEQRARQAVRAPAIALIVAGILSLFANLGVAGFGFVDQFVMPLTPESQARRAFIETTGRSNPPFTPGMARPYDRASDDSSTVIGMLACMSLTVASVATIWGGYDMLRLRGYWLSVAGSVAVMPAGILFCCIGGFPVGIWSLVILFKPEVSSSFRRGSGAVGPGSSSGGGI